MTRSSSSRTSESMRSDIEISDEMVILRANDGEIDRRAFSVARIEVHPSSRTVRPGDSITFTATCFDQHGRPMNGCGCTGRLRRDD